MKIKIDMSMKIIYKTMLMTVWYCHFSAVVMMMNRE